MSGDFSIGAVGAAVIAAVISLIGLIVAKENKTSEFRQEWINALRESISDAISAVAAMHIIADMIIDDDNAEMIAEAWRKVSKSLSLVELRLNIVEPDHLELQGLIRQSEKLIKRGTDGEDISGELELLQDSVTALSQQVLKREWDRVKDGEATFQLTKYGLVMIVGFALLKWAYGSGI
ncbi:hypothetical protein [Sphingomonas sp. Leaf34]|uniref:hypothetical protein n=1 Tax=Sphingomonas sp. Leaf34 TaxID=1736216 RepID=UPI0012E298E9|nr:hypothetical protein [Sphingomonas sp. Leaf34]